MKAKNFTNHVSDLNLTRLFTNPKYFRIQEKISSRYFFEIILYSQYPFTISQTKTIFQIGIERLKS